MTEIVLRMTLISFPYALTASSLSSY